MPVGPCILNLLCVALMAAPVATPAGQDSAPPSGGGQIRTEDRATLRQRIFRCFQDADYARAIPLIDAYLEQDPNDAQMIYNLACALARTGEADRAASALLRAVRAGFDDLEHLRSDPDLGVLRDHPTFKAVIERAERSRRRDARQILDLWRAAYGDERYRYEQDDERRLAYATALDETSHREMKEMLRKQADQMTNTLFGSPPAYFILIAVPAGEDSEAFFEGRENVGGIYKHADHRLIARDIGGSLRHEFVHALHYAHMERLGLATAHRLWVQEGLAALYEDYEWLEDGSIRFLPNNRHNVVKNRARAGRLDKWSDIFQMTSEQFMARSGRLYPQVRSMFRFIAQRGRLAAWYRAYVEGFEEDPGGARAFETVFEQPVEEVEKAWCQWVAGEPMFDDLIDAGDAALGIRSRDGLPNDGVAIAEVLPGSAARRGGLRAGDVIVSVDGRSTRSVAELIGNIGSKQIGDTVTVRLRRGERYLTVRITLRPRGPLR